MVSEQRLKTVVVGLGEMEISDAPDELLVAYSLGSCLGVTFYDPVLRVGGMAHCMLPLSEIDPEKAQANPGLFVDIGVPKLMEEMLQHGCRKKDLVARVAGASRMLDHGNFFRIGERNHTVFRKIMWKNRIFIRGEDIGGDQARTLRLEIATGRVVVQSQGVEREL